jgi:catechol 2,3-dioxygenase-like lactoylglutathione lyase family enzyme
LITGAHAIIYTHDAEGLRAFFDEVLGLPSVDAGHGWLIFALPPAELAVHPAEGGVRAAVGGPHPAEHEVRGAGAGPHPAEDEVRAAVGGVHPAEDEVRGAGAGPHPAEGAGGRTELYLMCDDLQEAVQELGRKGVALSRPIREERWGVVTAIRLPDGGELGLYEPRHPKPPR